MDRKLRPSSYWVSFTIFLLFTVFCLLEGSCMSSVILWWLEYCSLTLSFFYWYQLLKLMQKHGTIEKFDLIFHRTGPLSGQPKGYAFITYSMQEEAVAAKNVLHNSLVGKKVISVKWAHSINLVSRWYIICMIVCCWFIDKKTIFIFYECHIDVYWQNIKDTCSFGK